MLKRTLFGAATLVLVTLGGMSSAKPALKDVAYVREGIIAAGIAYEISEQCGTVSARLFRGISFLNGLKSHARSLGYTEAEIDAYVNDKEEKNRLEAIARDRLSAMGAVNGQAQSYCTVGRSEIAKGSTIGQLLR